MGLVIGYKVENVCLAARKSKVVAADDSNVCIGPCTETRLLEP